MLLVFFSVTTSWRPSGVNDTWAPPAPSCDSGCVEPGTGSSPERPMRNPDTLLAAPPLRT